MGPDWSNLPRDILTSIAKRLHTRLDILRFRAVCRSFRCSHPPPPNVLFPQSILRNLDFLRGPYPNDCDFFVPIQSTLYAVQPLKNETPQTWFVKAVESKSGRIRIRDPLSGYRFKNKMRKLPRSLNLLDYRVKEICSSYAFESAAIRKGKAKLSYNNEIDEDSYPFVLKKARFSSFLNESDDEFAVMAFGEYELSVWRNIDKKWSHIEINLQFSEGFRDIIYHNQKFYALTSTGRTLTVDSKSLTVTEVASRLVENPNYFFLVCWVESFKALISFVVDEDDDADDDGYVRFFMLNEEKREWVPIIDGSELEDTVFFLSGYDLCSVSAKEFPACKGNSFYFVDEDSDDEIDYPGQNARISDLRDLMSKKLPELRGDRKSKKISEFPAYSNLFWPPPTWLN